MGAPEVTSDPSAASVSGGLNAGATISTNLPSNVAACLTAVAAVGESRRRFHVASAMLYRQLSTTLASVTPPPDAVAPPRIYRLVFVHANVGLRLGVPGHVDTCVHNPCATRQRAALDVLFAMWTPPNTKTTAAAPARQTPDDVVFRPAGRAGGTAAPQGKAKC